MRLSSATRNYCVPSLRFKGANEGGMGAEDAGNCSFPCAQAAGQGSQSYTQPSRILLLSDRGASFPLGLNVSEVYLTMHYQFVHNSTLVTQPKSRWRKRYGSRIVPPDFLKHGFLEHAHVKSAARFAVPVRPFPLTESIINELCPGVCPSGTRGASSSLAPGGLA